MTQFVSNPFQVLGVSDNPTPLPPIGPAKPVTGHEKKGLIFLSDDPTPLPPIGPARPITEPVNPTPLPPIGPAKPVTGHEKKGLIFLESLGRFLRDDLLPIALNITLPLLEKRL